MPPVIGSHSRWLTILLLVAWVILGPIGMASGARRSLRRAPTAEPLGETDMMMSSMCGTGMMIVGALAAVLGLGLLASLIVLVWVAIGRLRRDRSLTTAR